MLSMILVKLAARSLAVSNPVQAGDREPRSSRGRRTYRSTSGARPRRPARWLAWTVVAFVADIMACHYLL